MRILGIVVLCAALVGCGLSQQAQLEKQRTAVVSEATEAIAQCNETYKKVQATAVARAKCIGDASLRVRAFSSAPDLFDQEVAGRNALAEKWQKGQITQAEYEFQFTQLHSQLESEGQRRALATRSVNAQEATATAALMSTGPVICNKVGTTTICN
jgi:hypothetical protein